jgi:MFS family permease
VRVRVPPQTPIKFAVHGARIFFLAGMFIVPTFLIYMVQDLMEAPDARIVAASFVGLTLLGAAAFAWPAARAIGKFGEVRVLLSSGSALTLAAGAFVLGVGWSEAVGYFSMALYGVASGFVMTAGISHNMKLIPPGAAAGRVMALVAAGTFLSQLIASLVGGIVLDQMNRISPGLGYYGLLGLLLAFMASGCRSLIAMERCNST